MRLLRCGIPQHNSGTIYGYARVSTDGQTVAAQVAALTAAGAGEVFREVASGAKTDRVQLRRALDQLAAMAALHARAESDLMRMVDDGFGADAAGGDPGPDPRRKA
jgi:hypothetical protein